jgi:hypothetical protein
MYQLPWSDHYTLYTCIHVSKCHTVPYKYLQLLCVNLKNLNQCLCDSALG